MKDYTNMAFKLTIAFLTDIKGLEPQNGQFAIPKAFKLKRVDEFVSLLNGGHTEQELLELMENYRTTHTAPEMTASVYEMFDYFDIPYKSVALKRDPNNLLVVGKSYVHPHLQITSPPPTMRVVDGVIIEESVPFFLEFKTSFTLQDLHEYFAQKMEVSTVMSPKNKGAYEYLLKHYDVELILFMIDESWAHHNAMNAPYPKNPLRLSDYEEEASELYFLRRDVCEEGGFLNGVPRQY